MERIKLFCIPFAGGSATIYSKWRTFLASESPVEVHPLELPGHGKKMHMPLIDNMEGIVSYLYSCIQDQLHERYAIFGHSMGSLIAYELCQYLQLHTKNQPSHAFFSGRKAPQQDPITSRMIHDLPVDEFIYEVCKYGGNTREALQNPQLRKLFIPILRSDFKLCETYQFDPTDEVLKYNISILYGLRDQSVCLDNLMPWQILSMGTCDFIPFDGGHFFINENGLVEKVIRFVQKRLARTFATQ